jgi:hypothetical protein
MNETIIALVIGIAVGVGLALLYLAYRIKLVMNTLDSYIEEALDQVKDSFITILVEKDNDTYYCYRREDRQFVCQGKTVTEVKDAFKAVYPDKVAIVSKDTAEYIVAEFKKELDENSISV